MSSRDKTVNRGSGARLFPSKDGGMRQTPPAGCGLDFTALVIGSMAPDFGYYVHQFAVATFAHSIAGSVVLCVPLGFLGYGGFCLIYAQVCYLLPQPHRGALMPLASKSVRLQARTLLEIALSIVLGAWTHCLWDSFTHRSGWAVQRIEMLRETLFRIGEAELPAYHLLQYASTVLGTVVLACAYFAWLRVQPRLTASSSYSASPGARCKPLPSMFGVRCWMSLSEKLDLSASNFRNQGL